MMSYVMAFAYIIYITYIVAFLGILAGAIFFARGDVTRGKRYIGGSAVLVLTVMILPYALDYIFQKETPTAGNFDGYVNFIHPYPDFVNYKKDGSGNTTAVELTYTRAFKATPSIVLIRLNFATTADKWVIRLEPYGAVEIPKDKDITVVVKYPNVIANNAEPVMQEKTFKMDQMVVTAGLNEINIDSNKNADITAQYEIIVGDGADAKTVTYSVIINYTKPEDIPGGGGGVWDWIKGNVVGAFSKVLNAILNKLAAAGKFITKYLPFMSGEETMIYFTILPTDNMLSSSGSIIKDFYYNVSLPWGIVILFATTILAGLERYWNGEPDLAFSLAKDVVGMIIWMIGGYYFYQAFAGFINTIIIDIGITYILKMGYYMDIMISMLLAYILVTPMISDNASGTLMGMIGFAIIMFQATAFMRFFLIGAVVALYPIIAPWGMLRSSGISNKGVIQGIVKQGVYGIIVAGVLRLIFEIAESGGSLAAGAMILPIAMILAPQLFDKFVGAVMSGDVSHAQAMSLAHQTKSTLQRAGLSAAGVVAGGIAARRAKKMSGSSDSYAETANADVTMVGTTGTGEPPADTGMYEEETETPTEVGAKAAATSEVARTGEEETETPTEVGTGDKGGGNGGAGAPQQKTKEEAVKAAALGAGLVGAKRMITIEKDKLGYYNVRIGNTVIRTKDKDTVNILRSIVNETKTTPTGFHRAELYRRLGQKYKETYTTFGLARAASGIRMITSGAVRKDKESVKVGVKELGRGLFHTIKRAPGSIIIHGYRLAAHAGAEGIDKNALEKIMEYHKKRKSAETAAYILERMAQEEELNSIQEIEMELAQAGVPKEKIRQVTEIIRQKAVKDVEAQLHPIRTRIKEQVGLPIKTKLGKTSVILKQKIKRKPRTRIKIRRIQFEKPEVEIKPEEYEELVEKELPERIYGASVLLKKPEKIEIDQIVPNLAEQRKKAIELRQKQIEKIEREAERVIARIIVENEKE